MTVDQASALEQRVPPRRLAAVARAVHSRLVDALIDAADAIEAELAHTRAWVAWDRVRLIGQAQQRLAELSARRFSTLGGGGARVQTRAEQPLESLALTWGLLRQGRPVVVQGTRGCLAEELNLLRSMSRVVGPPLHVCEADAAVPEYAVDWPVLGVEPAKTRVALVQADADPEAAAYLLARACLRRTGFDPRAVHRAVIVGKRPRFERHLRRLFYGARMGPPENPEAFAGPVSTAAAAAFAKSVAAWQRLPGVEVLCGGAELSRDAGVGLKREPVPADRGRHYLAPALLRLEVADSTDKPPVCHGPLLILEEVEAEDADRRLRALADRDAGALWLRFGQAQPGVPLGPEDRQIDQALLVEQLPPGLPAPRP